MKQRSGKNKNKPGYLMLLLVLGSAVLLLLITGGVLVAYHSSFNNRIFPGVAVGNLQLGGLTPVEAEKKLQSAWDKFANNGLPLKIGERELTLTSIITSATDPDLAYELVIFKAEATARAAYEVGHQGSLLAQFFQPISFRWLGRKLPAQVSVDMPRVIQFLRDALPGIEQEPKPAELVVDEADNINVLKEKSGHVIDQASLENSLKNNFIGFSVQPIVVRFNNTEPTLTEVDIMSKLPEVRQLLSKQQEITFINEKDKWVAKPSVWHRWLEVREENSILAIGFSTKAAEQFFSEIRRSINQPALDAKFELKDDKVVTFEPSREGRVLDILANLKSAEEFLASGDMDKSVQLVVNITKPNITTADANNFGIAEIIGVGTSNFAGSPKNRRHNISTGADKLNGVIIKPDEEFSLIKTLGVIDATTGYLEELVIKGDKTIPEFGGGLCQIGTTTFRAALASGLPILERQNHSYRVVYYEPAGTDATIYDPKPDFRFKNDTGNAILIQTKIKGNDLIFEFWGKKDGRVVEQTKPKISNVVKPPETKIVETEDLPVGEKKCTEKAHSGADTEFTYKVTYPDGREVKRVFKSHYVPWQAVCLVGVAKGTLKNKTAGDGSVILPSADTVGQKGN